MKTPHFNQLTPAEAERLSLLLEECGEVIQVIGKIQRHGYDSAHPDRPDVSNKALLAFEVGHVLAAMDMLLDQSRGLTDINGGLVERSRAKKARSYRAKKYLHHQ